MSNLSEVNKIKKSKLNCSGVKMFYTTVKCILQTLLPIKLEKRLFITNLDILDDVGDCPKVF